MPIEIGRRAINFTSTHFYAPVRNYVNESRVYKNITDISPISPVTIVSSARTTETVNGIFESLNRAIEMTAELRAKNEGAPPTRIVDYIRQEEIRSTESIWGDSGKYLTNLGKSAWAFVKNLRAHPMDTLKEAAKNNLINIPMASAAFYALGLLLTSLSSPMLTAGVTITAIASTIAVMGTASLHSVHPTNPTWRAINDRLKTWGLLGSGALFLTSVPYLLFKNDLSVINTFKFLPSWGIYGLLGAAGMIIAYKVIKAVIKFCNSRMAMKESPDKEKGNKMLIASKIAFYGKIGALMYVIPMYLGALLNFSATTMAADPLSAVTTVLGSLFVGKFFSNYKGGMKNLLAGVTIGSLPLLLWGGTSFLYLPTLFFFAPLCMLMGNLHAGIPSLSSASNHIGSLHYPAIPDVSDTDKDRLSYGVRGGKGRNVIRLNAFVNNKDTNFSNLINMFINPYPDVEFELCEEKKPWSGLGDLKRAMIMKEYLKLWGKLQGEIYEHIQKEFEAMKTDPRLTLEQKYDRLANLFNWLGRQMSEEKEWKDRDDVKHTPFLQQLLAEHEKDAKRADADQWFKHDLAPQFWAEGFQVMKDRAKEFCFPMQARFEERAKGNGGKLDSEELKKEYLRLLDIYHIRSNYIIRRLEHLDDQINQKTNNLSFVVTHSGDTLYKVWVLSKDGKEFYVEHVPSEYVRVDNPAYEHDKSVKQFLWLHRDDLKEVNQPLQFSESGSEEIERVNNTPDGVKEIIYKGKKMRGIESSDDVLTVKDYILRDFEKDGTTAAARLGQKLIWTAGAKKARVFGWDQASRKAITVSEDPLSFDSAFLVFAANKYMDVKDPKSAEFKRISDRYFEFLRLVGENALAKDSLEAALKIYQEKYNQDKKDKLGNYLALTGGKLWYEHPEVLSFKAVDVNDYWLVSDEEYIDFSSYIQLQGELQRDAHQQKDLRVFRYMPREHAIPYPWETNYRDPEKILHIERIGAPIEIGFKLDGVDLIVPYQENRTLLPAGAIGAAKWEWRDITHGIARMKDGKKVLELYSFSGKKGEEPKVGAKNFKLVGTIAEEDYPDQLPPPDKLNGQIISFNAFPERIGIYGYYMYDFGDKNYGPEPWQRYRFVRETEKPWQLWLNLIKDIKLDPAKKKLIINSLYPEAQVVPFTLPWADPGSETNDRLKVLKVDAGRERWVAQYKRADGSLYYQYAPTKDDLPDGYIPESKKELSKKSVIGMARYEKDGVKYETVIPLTEDLHGYGNPKHARDAILGTYKDGKITVIEGRRVAYNPETAASYLYTLKDHAKLVGPDGETEVVIPNYSWIKDTRVEQRGKDFIVVATVENPHTKEKSTYDILGSCLVDEEGVELLRNRSRNMDSLDAFFQKSDGDYSFAVERYRPEFMMFEGLPTLRLHAVKKDKKAIAVAPEIREMLEGAEKVEIYLASPTSAVKVAEKKNPNDKGKWVPLSLVDPIYQDDQGVMKDENFNPGKAIISEHGEERVEYYEDIREAETKYQGNPAVRFEKAEAFRPDIIHGDFGMVVHRQNSFGGSDAAEVRDQYFYARIHKKNCEIRHPKGEFKDPRLSIGLQGGKTNIYDANFISHSDAIENGTPFMATFLLLLELSRITGHRTPDGHLHAGNLESAIHHPFTRKLVTFSVFMGCLNGVSEDEELKKVMKKATGRKLRYSAFPTAVVAQPNEIAKLLGQNCGRYNTSSQLFNDIEWGQVKREFWNGWIRHNMPRIFEPKELLETCMTGFWYPGLPYSELGQMLGPTAYLFSGGNIQPYIVDHLLFLTIVAGDTPLSGWNYGLARHHGGFPLSWSFWNAPARDPIALLGGYWRGSRRMIREDWQYGQFIITADQKGKSLPEAQKSFLRFFKTSGGIANLMGWAALAAAVPIIGLSWLTVFPLLAIGLNTLWGTYKYALSRKAFRWLNTLEMDLKDNPQDITDLSKKIDDLIYNNNTDEQKIFSLLGARQLVKSALIDINYDPFELENNPSRHEDQVRTLLHQAFIAENKLLETAIAMGAEGRSTQDQLIAMTMLKNLATSSYSHDIGVDATNAYKRIIIKREEIAPLLQTKIAEIKAMVESKDPIDFDQLTSNYYVISSAWDQLDKTEKRKISHPLKAIGDNLGKRVVAMIKGTKVHKVEDLEKLASLIGRTLPLPIGARERKLISAQAKEKIDALVIGLNLADLKPEDLNLLYNFSSIGHDKGNIKESNRVKIAIINELYRREMIKSSFRDLAPALLNSALADLQNLPSSAGDLYRAGFELAKILNQATGASVKNNVKIIKKLTEELITIKIDLDRGIDRKKNASAFEQKKKALEILLRGMTVTAINHEYTALIGLQKEKTLLAIDSRARMEAETEIKKLFRQQLEQIEQISDLKLRAGELKKALENLTGFNNKNDVELSFRSAPELSFILKRIIPGELPKIMAIIDSCGTQAMDLIAATAGRGSEANPDRGGVLDRILRLRHRSLKINQRLPFLNMEEKLASAARHNLYLAVMREAEMSIAQYKQNLQAQQTVNNEMEKLTKSTDQLIRLMMDSRSIGLSEQTNGIIDAIQKLLELEKFYVLTLKAKATAAGATEKDKEDFAAAKKAYLDRVTNFSGAAKVMVDKKRARQFQKADLIPTLDREITQEQKDETTAHFKAIDYAFPKEEVE